VITGQQRRQAEAVVWADRTLRAGKRGVITLWIVVAALAGGLVAYSQTWAWFWDEGFHLLAAQLINNGKKPYLDFFYQHAPMYAYINAGWMRLFGENWRSAHAFSALSTGGCIALMAAFVFSRLRDPGWRLAGALAAVLMTGLHVITIQCGTVGEPYGLCLLLLMAAFRLAIEAVRRETGFLSLGVGLCAGAAADSSLLSASAAPVFVLWIFRHSAAKDRLRKCAWYAAGAVIPFLPLVRLAALAPRQTLFDVVEYHLFHRQLVRPNTTVWDLNIIAEVLTHPHTLIPALFAVVGLLFLAGRDHWDTRERAEFYLCAWLAGALCVPAACAHPTFASYFILAVPFLSILASVGIYAIGSQRAASRRPGWLVLPVVGLFAVPLARPAYHHLRNRSNPWQHIEEVGRQVDAVTPRNAEVWANEFVYFAAHRPPAIGLENYASQRLRISAELAASLHVVPDLVTDEWLEAGRYATAVAWYGDARVETRGLPRLYRERKRIHEFEIFWDRVAP